MIGQHPFIWIQKKKTQTEKSNLVCKKVNCASSSSTISASPKNIFNKQSNCTDSVCLLYKDLKTTFTLKILASSLQLRVNKVITTGFSQ